MANHLYTIDVQERNNAINQGWVDEGVVGFVAAQPTTYKCVQTVPLTRLFKQQSGDHFYTTSPREIISAQRTGYVLESICCHLLVGPPFDFQDSTLSPQFYRFNNSQGEDHFYTSDPKEAMQVQAEGYHREDLDGGFGDAVSSAMVLKNPGPLDNMTQLFRLRNG